MLKIEFRIVPKDVPICLSECHLSERCRNHVKNVRHVDSEETGTFAGNQPPPVDVPGKCGSWDSVEATE